MSLRVQDISAVDSPQALVRGPIGKFRVVRDAPLVTKNSSSWNRCQCMGGPDLPAGTQSSTALTRFSVKLPSSKIWIVIAPTLSVSEASLLYNLTGTGPRLAGIVSKVDYFEMKQSQTGQ